MAQRNPENLNKQAVASLRSDSKPDLSVSSTIASSISTVACSFFTTGLANKHCIGLNNGSTRRGMRPAVECTQGTALQASSTDDLDLLVSPDTSRIHGAWLELVPGYG